MSVPFAEQGGRLRGVLDVVSGRFPRFVFGGSVGHLLPVFHFHDETAGDLEPKLRYLAENRYRTVSCDDIAAYVAGTSTLPDRPVALCFDDAWSSVWTIAAPLLQTHGLQAIVYAIPGRTIDAATCRRHGDTAVQDSPFATWPELRALRDRGIADIQSHTFSHAMIAVSSAPIDFIGPGYAASSYLGRPLVDVDPEPSADRTVAGPFASPADLGAPLYATRSRMSDAPRVRHAPAVRHACMQCVAFEGGPAFFSRPGWREKLQTVAAQNDSPTTEHSGEQRHAIERELDEARSVLNAQLRTTTVNHVCLPWGVAGQQTHDALKRLGFATAVANRLAGIHAIVPGDDPLWLKRLPNRYIYRLPGEGRRWWFLAPR